MARHAVRTLLVVALSLFGLHAIYHVWQWLAWPPPDALESLYGPSDVGRVVHAVTEAIVVLALLTGLIVQGGRRCRPGYSSD